MKDNGFPLPDDEKILYGEFPKTFNWSTASASYQVSNIDTLFLQFQSAFVVH